jgi:hypothetical protein
VIGNGDSTANIAKSFFGRAHTKVLIERLRTVNRRLVYTLTATNVVRTAITLYGAKILAAVTA